MTSKATIGSAAKERDGLSPKDFVFIAVFGILLLLVFMVFSIIFNKPFWVIGNAQRGMSRFTSLLKIFHLEDRLLDTEHLDEVDFSKSIDWVRVNAILEEKRNECKLLLLNKLKE